MPTGTVAFFHDRKGYGFIETDAADDDVFFHVEDLDGFEPSEGDELEFDVVQGEKGPRAENIRLL